MRRTFALLPVLIALAAAPALAGPQDFQEGAVIPGYGKFASVTDPSITPDSVFKIVYDVSAAEAGKPNASLDRVARFLNMTAAAGVPAENVQLAVVVHGPATEDLRKTLKDGSPNPSAQLVTALIAAGVSVQLCGQAAVMRDAAAEDLIEGVTITLSAMTAHAQLQQQGYTLNPF